MWLSKPSKPCSMPVLTASTPFHLPPPAILRSDEFGGVHVHSSHHPCTQARSCNPCVLGPHLCPCSAVGRVCAGAGAAALQPKSKCRPDSLALSYVLLPTPCSRTNLRGCRSRCSARYRAASPPATSRCGFRSCALPCADGSAPCWSGVVDAAGCVLPILFNCKARCLQLTCFPAVAAM